jgi:hypothetical protein
LQSDRLFVEGAGQHHGVVERHERGYVLRQTGQGPDRAAIAVEEPAEGDPGVK